ncbi:MAG: peptidase M22 [Clostridia bacterium]|nr:peptidase M22 [Clostridia bacterium]
MSLYLGIDTSNYTTSAALYDADSGEVRSARRLLPVKSGEKGIRQSDAVFHHTAALPEMIAELTRGLSGGVRLTAAGASDKPSNIAGSYMPCFTVGASFVASLCALNGMRAYYHSHQHGHIAAALWSARQTALFDRQFVAFHVSGGTTEAVLCTPSPLEIFTCERLLYSSDLKAGQAIDRVGVMLGLSFPAGKALDALSLESDRVFKIKPSVRDGCPSLSGIQNQCETMFKRGEKPCDIALFCLKSVSAALGAMTAEVRRRYPSLPIVYSGGVTANTMIRKDLSGDGAVFADPAWSSDNAVGAAVLAAEKDKRA